MTPRSEEPAPTRRAFLRLAAACTFVGFAGLRSQQGLAAAGAAPVSWSLWLRRRGLAGAAVDRLAVAYLAKRPEERQTAVLMERLLLDAHAGPSVRALQGLAERHREDLAQDRLEVVDGWLLTRTESRLLALAHLG